MKKYFILFLLFSIFNISVIAETNESKESKEQKEKEEKIIKSIMKSSEKCIVKVGIELEYTGGNNSSPDFRTVFSWNSYSFKWSRETGRPVWTYGFVINKEKGMVAVEFPGHDFKFRKIKKVFVKTIDGKHDFKSKIF